MNVDNKELEIIIKQIKDGDQKAFDRLHTLTYRKAYFFSLSITKDEEMSKDIMQEVYIIVFKNINSLKDNKLFIAWLNKITYNVTMKELNKQQKRPIAVADEDVQKNLVDNETPMVKCLADENTKEMMNSIMSLKEKYRTVLILKYFNDYKIKDIAKILECPEGTVKSRLNTAKSVLKEHLSKKHNRYIVSFAFSFLVTSALKKSAKASVVEHPGNIVLGEALVGTLGVSFLYKFVPVVISGALVTVGISNIDFKSKENSIVEINYEKELTRNSLEVDMVFSHLNKDNNIEILTEDNKKIDKVTKGGNTLSFIADKNGVYDIVELKDDGTTNTLGNIKISNIDNQAPIIKSYEVIDGILNIYVGDTLSGIDFNKIKLYNKNLENKEIKIIDKVNNILYVENVKEDLTIELYDNVGNYRIYKIENK